MTLSLLGSILKQNGFKIIAIFTFVITFYMISSVNEKNKINLHKQNFAKDIEIKALKNDLNEKNIIHRDVFLKNEKTLMQIELTAQNLRADKKKKQNIRDGKIKQYHQKSLTIKDNNILAEMINCEFRNFNNTNICH